MFTTGTDITTAITDLINAAAAAYLMGRLIKKGNRTKRVFLWVAAFALFILVCVTGFFIHGLTVTAAPDINQLLRKILMVEMAYMLAFYTSAIWYDVLGERNIRKALIVWLTSATAFSVIAIIIMSLIAYTYGFTVFVIYCVATLIVLIITLIKHRREKNGLTLYLVSAILLAVANCVQQIKTIRFEIIWEFNYDSVYHAILLVFLIIQYIGIGLVGKNRNE